MRIAMSNNFMNRAIVVRGLKKFFPSGRESTFVLKKIDWEIPAGNIELLMGPSGSGKTTLLSILAGLLSPTEGTVEVLGHDITKMKPHELSKFRLDNIGFIFQDFNLFPALTAAENVELVLNLKGIYGQLARSQAFDLLSDVELKGKEDQKPITFSKGEQQRVAIARALAGNPKIIMADEPTASLDRKRGETVIQLISKLAREKGCTVLIVTHDPRIEPIADHITLMDDGVLKNLETGCCSKKQVF